MNHPRANFYLPALCLRIALIALFLITAAGWAIQPARAASQSAAAPALTIRVNIIGDSTGSDNFISIREAILMVNGGTGGDGLRTGLNRPLSAGEKSLVTGGTIGAAAAPATIVFTDLLATDVINVTNTTGGLDESLPPILTSGVVLNGATATGQPVTIQGLVAGADVLWLGWVDPANTTNPAFTTVDGVTVTNVKIMGAGRYAIHLESATNSTVSNCIVMNSTSFGIYINSKFAQASGNTVDNCTVGPNSSLGIVVNRPGSHNTTISNNRIGTNEAGTAAAPNTGAGLGLYGGTHDDLITGNLISGNTLQGIYLEDKADPNTSTTNIFIYNNKIGTALDGITPLPNVQGIMFNQISSANTIGGSGANQANIIAFNVQSGVVVFGAGTVSNHISGNSIFGNGVLGIDLGDDKVPTVGVSGGAAGPNNLSLRPTLTKALVTGSLAAIAGTASPNATVEIFTADPNIANLGSGKTYCQTATAGPSGAFSFNGILNCVPGSAKLTATATLVDGSTSEFGLDVATTPTPANYLAFVHP